MSTTPSPADTCLVYAESEAREAARFARIASERPKNSEAQRYYLMLERSATAAALDWENKARKCRRRGGRMTTCTYSLAMAAGKDAADRQMRKAGRSTWSVEDYTLMVTTVDRLYPVPELAR